MKLVGFRTKPAGMQRASTKRRGPFPFLRQLFFGRSKNRRFSGLSKQSSIEDSFEGAKPSESFHKRKSKNKQTFSFRDRWQLIRSSLSQFVKILGIVLTMGGIFGIGYGIVRFLRTSKHFAIQHLSISPLKYIDAEKVHTYAQTFQGENLFRLDLEKAQRKLAEIPGVAYISIRRKIPNSLIIEIKEHIPTMVVDLEGPYCANAEGEIFRRATPEEMTTLPILVGIKRMWFQLHGKEAKERIYQAIAFTKLYGAQGGGARPELEGLRFTSQEGPTDLVVYTKQGVELWISFDRPEDTESILKRFDLGWAELTKKPTRPTVLLLNNRAHPDWVVARY